jgi:Flp pilus assembly protein TadD
MVSALERRPEAVTDYSKAIELDPRLASAYANRGLTYYETGEYAAAEADLSEVLRLDPKNQIALNARGLVYGDTGRFALAFWDFRRLSELDPRDQETPSELDLRSHPRARLLMP